MSAIFAAAAATYHACRAEYQDLIEAAYVAAETETSGKLLNDRGRAAGIDPFSLFKGPAIRAYAYASPELVEHWSRWPRVTFADYERQWFEQ